MAWTRQLSCGFEAVDFTECDWSGGDKGTISSWLTTNVKTGNYAFLFGGAARSTLDGPGRLFSSAVSARAAMFYLYSTLATTSTTGTWFFRLRNTAAQVIGIRYLIASGLVELVVNNVVVASDTLTNLLLNDSSTHRHVACTFKADATAGYLSLYVDGIRKLTWTGNTGADVTEVYVMQGVSGASACLYNGRIDDLYIDTSASAETDIAPGALRFIPCYPTAAGNSTQWTPNTGANWAAVDETGAPDGNTTYISTAVTAQADLYTIADPVIPERMKVQAVVLVAIASNSEAGPGLQLGMKTGTDTRWGSTQTIGTTYGAAVERFTTQGDAVTVWNEAAFAAAELGVKSVI